MGMGKSTLTIGGRNADGSPATFGQTPAAKAASDELAAAMRKPDMTDDLVKKAARGSLSRLRAGYGRKGTFLVGDAFGNTLGG
jgi:hypothetical protein